MKSQTRDLALIGLGFLIGAVVTMFLATFPSNPPQSPASSKAPLLVPTSFASQSNPVTKIAWQLPFVHIELQPRSIDQVGVEGSLHSSPQRSTDLIDLRYTPDKIFP